MDPLAAFDLTQEQRRAATESERDVLLSAGAGTGKTRTLVARYVHLLERGLSERQIVAITFTDKAAREMRNRIRAAVAGLAAAGPEQQRVRWLEQESRMDAARIGTIHSLCAEILRAHPAEARLDPAFRVVDEGLGLTFKARAVADALAWAATDPEAARLFQAFSTGRLAAVLARLLQHRLEATDLLGGDTAETLRRTLLAAIQSFTGIGPVVEGIQALRALAQAGELEADAGPTLAPRAARLLEGWESLEQALAAGDLVGACSLLFSLRREALPKVGGRTKGRARAIVYALHDLYDQHLNPWIGGANAKDSPPSIEVEAAWQEQLPRLRGVFEQALNAYRRSLDSVRGLDFDDLEAGALALLESPGIGDRWRDRLQAVLVDEFQDTNERQRRITQALTGGRPGRLFAVGDARQSIYRFRGADVRVFRRVRQAVQAAGGRAPEIDLSFRAHAPLLEALDDLIGPIMGTEESGALYQIPYTPLSADRPEAEASGAGPHLEIVLGTGPGAEPARAAAARALANRLVELRREGVIRGWGDAALLFRASTGFEACEAALEAAGIPFVTVAGRGFYDRPEIRDLINALRAIADPSDDLALAGFLRSPAVGLSDPGLYRLRVNGAGVMSQPGEVVGQPAPSGHPAEARPLLQALSQAEQWLEPHDLAPALRARAVLQELHPLADRLPVAELISRLVGLLDWRAVLASSHARLWRNLDKLIDDAQVSELVNVGAFLEYLAALRGAGAREGEAPAGEGGSLQLMTIHKAKGLEFEVVVLADASRASPQRAQPVYLLDEVGAAAAMDRAPGDSIAYRLARALDTEQAQAEEGRLLYVAATRARERLIVSGHLSQTRGGWSAAGWLKQLLDHLALDARTLAESAGAEELLKLPGGQMVRLWTAPETELRHWEPAGSFTAWPDSPELPLYRVAAAPLKEEADPELDQEPERTWRATSRRAPAVAVGRIVHAAIQRSAMPGSDGYQRFIENEALRAGLVDERQRAAAIAESTQMLARLAAHPLWQEVRSAPEAQPEIPFTAFDAAGLVQSGQIDLLWRGAAGWEIVDFKTDALRSQSDLQAAVDRHRRSRQVQRYVEAAAHILGETPRGRLCFLDARGEVTLVDV
jgi:ATP-dependent helicase/nuclease subunit A